ncbi:MAG TPA: PLD nuclease N-terminal domain-containing protein [Anaerolineales bacterium]|nr:PLD nuclease N-terminal domain-containing protein [Anaerolineales bacterium]
MDEFLKYLPLIIPLILIQLALMIFALIDLGKREKTRGPKWMWLIIIIFGELLGPIVYFIVGRPEE